MNTKIYGTVGPACCNTEVLTQLFEQGMTGVRVNLSHVNLPEVSGWIQNIKTAHAKVGKTELQLLIDLRGPELRLGKLLSERLLSEGDHLTVMSDGETNLFDPTEIPVPKSAFEVLEEGRNLLIDDGKIMLKAEEKNSRAVECVVVRGGILKSGKSLAVPGVRFDTPTLTESDIENICQAKRYGVTGVMLPFVRGKEDLQKLKQVLIENDAADLCVLAKIENMDGVEDIKELLPYCDEIVIARGDLGNAMPLWKLPVVQAELAGICREAKKPFMIVTQMLYSMEKAAVPTRAEVSDIFRAVSEGASSVMLTGETAVGNHPVEAMKYMTETVREAETYIRMLK